MLNGFYINYGRCEKMSEIKDKLDTAKQCIDFKGIICNNLDCKNTICPLNKDYEMEG